MIAVLKSPILVYSGPRQVTEGPQFALGHGANRTEQTRGFQPVARHICPSESKEEKQELGKMTSYHQKLLVVVSSAVAQKE